MKCLAVVALIGFCAARADAGRPLALEDYYRVQTASSPAISPDGRWVVFVRTNIIEAENRRHTELWISPSDGSAPARRLTSAAFNASAPRWSRMESCSRFAPIANPKAPTATYGSFAWMAALTTATHSRFLASMACRFSAPITDGSLSPRKRHRRSRPAARSAFEKQLDQRFKGKYMTG